MDGIDQNEFLAAFGITEDTVTTDTTVEDTGTDDTAADSADANTDDTNADDTDSGTTTDDTAQTTPAATPNADEKAAYAYAQLRSENAQTNKILTSVAQLLGLDPKQDKKTLEETLKGKILESQSKQTNIPVELLQKVEKLEQRDAMFTQEQLKNATYTNFQKLQQDFKLSVEDIQNFTTQLVMDGNNPFEKEVDIEATYLKQNWQNLVAQAEARGAQAEAERAAKANTQSSTPNNKNGKQPADGAKINSVKDLNSFFSSLS